MTTVAVTYRFFMTHDDSEKLEEAVGELDNMLGHVTGAMEEHCVIDAKQVDTEELTDNDDN